MSQKRRNQKRRKLGLPPSTRPGAAFRNDAAGQLPAFRHRFLTETCPWIERSTVSFIHVRKDPHTDKYEILDKDRSGVFLRINDDYFILTAVHFIHSGRMPDYVEDEYILGVSWDDDDEDYIRVNNVEIALTPDNTLDIAAIKLRPEITAKLLKRHTPLTLDRIDRDCRRADGYFAIVGYPRAGFQPGWQGVMEAHPHPPGTESLKFIGERSGHGFGIKRLEYNPNHHLIIKMDKEAVRAVAEGHSLPEHEQIQGISGCGIWLIADDRRGAMRKPLSQYGPDDCKLVAIEHTYDVSEGKVAGTWIGLALALIARDFPDTEAAIKQIVS